MVDATSEDVDVEALKQEIVDLQEEVKELQVDLGSMEDDRDAAQNKLDDEETYSTLLCDALEEANGRINEVAKAINLDDSAGEAMVSEPKRP